MEKSLTGGGEGATEMGSEEHTGACQWKAGIS